MKVVTPEGYTFVMKFQEDNSHKVLRSVDFFSIKFDEIFFDTVCWVVGLRPRVYYTLINFRGGGQGPLGPSLNMPMLVDAFLSYFA